MDSKIASIVRGAIIIALGVLVAIYGAAAVADTYFAVVFLIVGIASLLLAGVSVARKLPLPVMYVILGAILIAIAIGLFTNQLSFGVFISLAVFIIMGAGAGLMISSIYFLAKKQTPLGIAQLVCGAVCVLLAGLYIGLPDFRKAFWIIVGIVIALYGAVVLVTALMDKKGSK